MASWLVLMSWLVGGLAMTHGEYFLLSHAKADDFGYISLEHTLAVAAAVVSTQRDLGEPC